MAIVAANHFIRDMRRDTITLTLDADHKCGIRTPHLRKAVAVACRSDKSNQSHELMMIFNEVSVIWFCVLVPSVGLCDFST